MKSHVADELSQDDGFRAFIGLHSCTALSLGSGWLFLVS